MNRYLPSRHYWHAALAALVFSTFSAWCGTNWPPAYVPASLFLLSAVLLVILALRPAIEIHETHVSVGKRVIPWSDIKRLDRTGWISPLVVHLTLTDNSRVVIIYPGDTDAAHGLLRQLRRNAREAHIDGIPYRQFWGDAMPGEPSLRQIPSARYRLLRAEDEAEVERLYQRLKTVGHLDPKNSGDEQ